MFSYLREQVNVSHQSFADAIRKKIVNGELTPGDKLPTLTELSSQTGLANYSVRKAILLLVEAGVLQTEQGGGVYISDNTSKVKIALADTYRFNDSGPQLRHPRTISGVYSAVHDNVVVDVLRPDTDFTSPNDVQSQIEAGDYDGIIWLYPEDDRIDCIKQISKKIPVVLTSHSRIDLDLPAVESDEAWNASRVGNYFLNLGVEQVIQFVEPWTVGSSTTSSSGGHSGGIVSIKYTLLEGGCKDYKTIQLSDSEIKYRDILLKSLDEAKDNAGIFIANTECFRAVLDAEFESITSHFSRLNIVIATSEDAFGQLGDIAEKVDIMACINPLAEIGVASVQKLTNMLSGLNEDNSTIVRIKFGSFNELITEHAEMVACAV